LDSGKKHPSLLRVAIDSVYYPNHKRVLDRVALEISAGETVALIGQSGSGKSTLALAILRLLDWKRGVVNGRIEFGAHGDLLRLPEREMRSIRGKEIALVLQSAASALNPMLRISTQFEVDLPSDDPSFLRRYPKEISIGQAQRVLIAMSLLHDPRLLLADEPTSALDIVTQQEVLGLLRRLAASRRMATLFISHDLLSVAALCDRVAILHEGEIVEEAETAAIFRSPAHPYTRRLIGALPRLPVEVPPDGVTPLLALAEQTGSSPGDLGGPAKWVAAESSKSA
jgi:ABC-type dipeptide/oligopeptide/nickel transport system ATPase component